MDMRARIGQGFVVDIPEGGLTAHFGADYRHQRVGILPGIGFRFLPGLITFDFRAQLPVYYESTSVRNIQNPLVVLDLKPTDVEDYQKNLSRVNAGFVLSFRIGVVLSRKEEN
jgi:hypothetical protein